MQLLAAIAPHVGKFLDTVQRLVNCTHTHTHTHSHTHSHKFTTVTMSLHAAARCHCPARGQNP